MKDAWKQRLRSPDDRFAIIPCKGKCRDCGIKCYNGGKEKRLSYDANRESVDQSKEERLSLIDGILNERFLPLPGYGICRFCDYQSICEAKESVEE